MLFNSFEFIFLFLPITILVYFLFNKLKLIEIAKGWLVFASLFFYGFWAPKYIVLIVFSMIFNYTIGKTLNSEDNIKLKISRKAVATFGVIVNVGLLCYFKYTDFFISNLNRFLHTDFNLLHIVLPLAISFFTFQQIAYVIDSYQYKTKEYDFLNYCLFVTFFPQLIAGPIVHHSEMMPQFARLRTKIFSNKNFAAGLFMFSIGLFKKVMIADNFGLFVNECFKSPEAISLFESWLAAFGYSFQLYFDFSGYTDMAIGIAMMMNIKLPQNFNSPFKSLGEQEFWRRWHMTLSRFLRDYVYFPLGGSRCSEIKTYRNLFLTFLIGGIWHGAGWTYTLWGVLHGLGLIVQRIYAKLKLKDFAVINWGLTFLFVVLCFVVFRASNITNALSMFKAMLHISNKAISPFSMAVIQEDAIAIILSILGFILIWLPYNSNQLLERFKTSKRTLYFASICFIIAVLSLNKISEFLYFQF